MVIGLDIGGTNIKGVCVDARGTILSKFSVPTGTSIATTEKNILHCITTLLELSHKEKKDIAALGIGSAGAIDTNVGMVITSPNIPTWKNYPIVQRLGTLTGLQVFLDNDANAAVYGELWFGLGKNFSNWIMIALGTGIGGGAVINGKPYTGRAGSAMEFGHTTIDYNGLPCKCGRKGCLECYGSATAVVNFTLNALSKYPDSILHTMMKTQPLTSKMVYEAAKNNDALALYIFNIIGNYLGIGIANLANIFNPEAVIFAGGLSLALEFFLDTIIQQVDALALQGMKENIRYLPVTHGEFTAALGAAKIALDNIS
ncbi:MAG: ROK family protein [Spirochaetota bacterium]